MISGKLRSITILLVLGIPFLGFCQMSFSEITLDAGIDHHYLGVNEMGGGAAFFDMDNDGDDDLWISGGLNNDVLYENDGQGNFSDISSAAGLRFTNRIVTTGVITGDIDNDGFRDVLLITHRGFSNTLIRNNGDNTFSDVTLDSGIDTYKAYSLAAAMGDINLDGYLDIYAANYIEKDKLKYDDTGDTVIGFAHQGHENKLYINNGDWTFTEADEEFGVGNTGCALATTFSDFDNDNDPDILVANDFGAWISPNALYENNYPENSFNDASQLSGMDVGIYGMGIAVGDYDQDLDLDYYITNLGRNVLMQNQGNGTFIDYTEVAGVENIFVHDSSLTVGWGTAFMDFDNDTDLDLFVTNGWVPAAPFINNSVQNPNQLYENIGGGKFEVMEMDSIIASPLRGRGYACSDIDGDGDLDFIVINVNRQATPGEVQAVQLYRNDSDLSNNWIQIKLQGTTNNKDGFGSKILLATGGEHFLQEVNGGYGTHASQHSSTVHFGLKEYESIDSIWVIWPGGSSDLFTDIEANQTMTLSESQTTSILKTSINDHTVKVFPNPFHGSINIDFSLLKEDPIQFKIFDVMGREVFKKSMDGSLIGRKLEWESRDAGVYTLFIETEHYIINKKLIAR